MYSASLTPKSLLPDMISVFLSVHLCITPLTNTGALRWPAYRSASRQPQYLKLRTVRDIVLCSLLLKYYFEGWIWSSGTYHSGEKNQKKTTLFDAVLVEKASLLTFMKNDVNAFVKDTIHTAHCISYISAIETHTHTLSQVKIISCVDSFFFALSPQALPKQTIYSPYFLCSIV